MKANKSNLKKKELTKKGNKFQLIIIEKHNLCVTWVHGYMYLSINVDFVSKCPFVLSVSFIYLFVCLCVWFLSTFIYDDDDDVFCVCV